MDTLNLVEITPLVDIKVIQETLTRIGIVNKKTKTIFPSCYLYENFGKFYICHFKEMFLLTRENGYNNISEGDTQRRNSIVFCLKNWKLIDVDEKLIENHAVKVDVVKFGEKKDYIISHKFNINSVVIRK